MQKETDAFVRIVRQLHENALNTKSNTEQQSNQTEEAASEEVAEAEGDENTNNSNDVVGNILSDVASYFRRERVEVLGRLLPEFVNQGLPISSQLAMRLSDKLGSEMTPKISELLGKMSSGELKLKSLKNGNPRKRTLDELSVEGLLRKEIK